MSVLGPMVVVAEQPATDLIDILTGAGAFPIIETSWRDAPAAVAKIAPVALAIAETAPEALDAGPVADLLAVATDAQMGPFIPIFARGIAGSDDVLPGTLPIDTDEGADRLTARIRAASRVRLLHATAIHRAQATGHALPAAPDILGDGDDDATVLCVGRGRSYPALAVAIGERAGVVGALSIEAAAQCLRARDIDGIVIGDGFSPRIVDALLMALAEDARFRELPIAIHGRVQASPVDASLPNLMRLDGAPLKLVRHILPYVRLQAFEARLKRLMKSFETQGMVDQQTGLLRLEMFWRELDRAVTDAADRGGSLSVARIAFGMMLDERAALDGARLVARLVRDVDVACQDEDGTILIAFTDTDLRAAHVVARRLAASLRQNIVVPEGRRRDMSPTVTLATLKPIDTVYSLMARISAFPAAAAV